MIFKEQKPNKTAQSIISSDNVTIESSTEPWHLEPLIIITHNQSGRNGFEFSRMSKNATLLSDLSCLHSRSVHLLPQVWDASWW